MPLPGACGRGCGPVPQFLYGGEDCLSEASSAAQAIGTGAKAPGGPRPGANGFGSFCRNKRTSSCGGETPHERKDTGSPIKSGMTGKKKLQIPLFARNDHLRDGGGRTHPNGNYPDNLAGRLKLASREGVGSKLIRSDGPPDESQADDEAHNHERSDKPDRGGDRVVRRCLCLKQQEHAAHQRHGCQIRPQEPPSAIAQIMKATHVD